MSQSVLRSAVKFYLIPLNKQAKSVLNHPSNRAFLTTLPGGEQALKVGHIHPGAGTHTLTTLGRENTDIYVGGSSISRLQCSFEFDSVTDVVVVCDNSSGRSTLVSGGDIPTSFDPQGLRRFVVGSHLDTVLSMGNDVQDFVQFKLCWPTQTAVEYPNRKACGEEDVEMQDVVLTDQLTPIKPPNPGQQKMRYSIRKELGAGRSGTVFEAVDADSGKLIAVKLLNWEARSRRRNRGKERHPPILQREMWKLIGFNHDWTGTVPEIFMSLKEGNLQSLVANGHQSEPGHVFHHMLQALEYLALHGMIHRNVKPTNILWSTRADGKLDYILGDFGVRSHVKKRQSNDLSDQIYMAPEMWKDGSLTTKVDVWSLFVTMLWVLDVEDFRQYCQDPLENPRFRVIETSSSGRMSYIREMAEFEPEKRASAAQMLAKCFKGK